MFAERKLVRMTRPIDALAAAVDALRRAWAEGGDAAAFSGSDLIGVNAAISAVKRLADAVHAPVASQVAQQSHSELGAESLAKQQGFRSATQLIAATSGISSGDAARLVALGDAVAPGVTITGEQTPARHPHLAEALDAGAIGAPAASRIIAMLERVVVAAGVERMLEGERILVEQAPGLTLDQLAKLILRVEAWLDPDGAAPREEEQRAGRSLTMFQRNGNLHISGVFDPVSGAPIRAFLEGYVSAQFQARREAAAPTGSAPLDGVGAFTDDGMPKGDERFAGVGMLDGDEDRRTVPQLHADGLVALAEHALGCDSGDVPVNGARVIVRVDLEGLVSGAGSATIDGMEQPISISAARKIGASGSVIPWVCGGESEILDWGREKRLFTAVQKLALAERDGGCAMCGLPPGMTKAHHIRWWRRDAGPTDLQNGVLLCESCHHRIHNNGWEVRVEGVGVTAKVWFTPPPYVDPARTPRLGGRARYDLVA